VRKDRGWTQERLSEAIGIEPVTLSRLETGDRALSLSTLASIANVLQIPIADLLDVGKKLPVPKHDPELTELIRLFGTLTPSQRDVLLRLVRELAAKD
jgi:transcriptional regulator with XRE-family HTH domain